MHYKVLTLLASLFIGEHASITEQSMFDTATVQCKVDCGITYCIGAICGSAFGTEYGLTLVVSGIVMAAAMSTSLLGGPHWSA